MVWGGRGGSPQEGVGGTPPTAWPPHISSAESCGGPTPLALAAVTWLWQAHRLHGEFMPEQQAGPGGRVRGAHARDTDQTKTSGQEGKGPSSRGTAGCCRGLRGQAAGMEEEYSKQWVGGGGRRNQSTLGARSRGGP